MKRLIPKMLTAWGTMPRDATYVASPYVEERVPYTMPQHKETYISSPLPDFRTQAEKDRDRRVAESAENLLRMEEGAKKVDALIKFTLPSTYVGPLFRDGNYWDNLSSGEGTGNGFGNLVLDMFSYSLPSMGRRVIGRGVKRNIATTSLGDNTYLWRPEYGKLEIRDFIKQYTGKTYDESVNAGKSYVTPDFELYTYYGSEDPSIMIKPTKENSIYRYADWLKKKFNIEIKPEDLTATIMTSKHFGPLTVGGYSPEYQLTFLNAKRILDPEVFLSTYLHEAVSHGSDASALTKTLRELGFTEKMLNMGSLDKSRLTLDSNVEDLLRETIKQLPNSKNMVVKYGDVGIEEPYELRALLQETRKKIWDAAGGDEKKFNEMIDKMTISDIVKYMPQSGYADQFNLVSGYYYDWGLSPYHDFIYRGLTKNISTPEKDFLKGGFTNRLKDILKYVPASAALMYSNNEE